MKITTQKVGWKRLEYLYEPYQLVAGCKYNSLPEANLSSNLLLSEVAIIILLGMLLRHVKSGHHVFSCLSLLLSTTVFNCIYCTYIYIYML